MIWNIFPIYLWNIYCSSCMLRAGSHDFLFLTFFASLFVLLQTKFLKCDFHLNFILWMGCLDLKMFFCFGMDVLIILMHSPLAPFPPFLEQSGTCNLREAVIFGSIIEKVSIPPLHSRYGSCPMKIGFGPWILNEFWAFGITEGFQTYPLKWRCAW